MKYWLCPKCGISNPIYLRLCSNCRYIRKEKDITLKTSAFWKCEWCGVLNVSTRYVCRRCLQKRYRIEPLTSEDKRKATPYQG